MAFCCQGHGSADLWILEEESFHLQQSPHHTNSETERRGLITFCYSCRPAPWHEKALIFNLNNNNNNEPFPSSSLGDEPKAPIPDNVPWDKPKAPIPDNVPWDKPKAPIPDNVPWDEPKAPIPDNVPRGGPLCFTHVHVPVYRDLHIHFNSVINLYTWLWAYFHVCIGKLSRRN